MKIIINDRTRQTNCLVEMLHDTSAISKQASKHGHDEQKQNNCLIFMHIFVMPSHHCQVTFIHALKMIIMMIQLRQQRVSQHSSYDKISCLIGKSSVKPQQRNVKNKTTDTPAHLSFSLNQRY